jgi:diguanylate cyclase (GGDEF)-like protein/PAS domain S-box-containing protein
MNDRIPHDEEALQARLAALAPGLDQLTLPACVFDTQLRYRHANAAYCVQFGRTFEQLFARTPGEVFEKPPSDRRREMLARALSGVPCTLDRETFHGENAGTWQRAHYIPARDGDAVIGVVVLLVDIQPLRDSQLALADRERQLSLITDSVGFPITYLDRDRIVRFANRPSCEWAGLEPAQFLGKRVQDITAPEVFAATEPYLARALSGEHVTYERAALWLGREERRIRGHIIPDKDERGDVRGVLVVVIDIEADHRLQLELLEKTRRLQMITENVGIPMSYIDSDWRFRYTNQTGLDWLPEAAATGVIGKHLSEVFSPEVMSLVQGHIARALTGEKVIYERHGTNEQGERKWIRVHLIPDVADDGAVRGIYSVVVDIDQDQKLRYALVAQEEKLRFFTDNIPEAIAWLDPDFRYRFANKVFATIRGQNETGIVGNTVADVLGEDAAKQYFEPYIEALRRGETCSYERLVGPPGGEGRWLLVRLVPQMTPDGTFEGLYVVSSDIHDIKLAQERLAHQEAQLRLFTDNIPDSVAYLDPERRYVFVNRTFAEQRGMSREHIIGRTSAEVLGQDAADELQPLVARVQEGESVAYERLITLSTGEKRWIHVRSVPDRAPDASVRGHYVVGHDVHDLKSAQQALEDKERELRQVIDSIPTPMAYVDADIRYRYVNDAFLGYIGLPAEEVIGQPVRDVLGNDRWGLFAPILERVKSGESLSVERLITFADGRKRWMIVRLTARMDGAGRFIGYYATTSDIHEQKSVEEELRRANSILSAHFDNTPLAVIEWDPAMHVVRWSGEAEAIFGWGASETLGRSLSGWRIVFEEDEQSVSAMFERLFAGPGSQATILNRNYRKDGSVIWVEWHNSALRDETGRVISVLSLAQDVSSRIQAEERLQYMATHDGLTGLPNRVLLNDRLEAAIARARRTERRVAVMFLDLDHFKDVNDTLGHRVGDELLKDLSRRIRATLRQTDLLVRIAGDEFVVVLEDLEGDEGPERVAQKVLDDVMRPFPLDGHEVHVSASLGFAIFPRDGDDPDTLLKNADAAMYQAKELGRNSFRAFSASLGERREQRREVEASLRHALKGNELELHYQPIVEIGDGVKRVEALIRWRDPCHGLRLPGAFIPLAEETGLVHELGHWVLEAACTQVRKWHDAGIGPLTVCVNLSAGQLRDSAMVADVKATLERTNCNPAWLEFEVTETSMVRDLEGVSLTLAKLRRLGVRIAIDDFGTGFSSLSHLRHLPVDTLKIDKSFVADIDAGSRSRDAGGAAIVSAVIGLARGLGLDVIAEGVERQSQLDFLVAQGCAAYQGYLICPPVTAVEFEKWLAARVAAPKKAKARSKPKAPPKRAAAKKNPATSKSKRARRPKANR